MPLSRTHPFEVSPQSGAHLVLVALFLHGASFSASRDSPAELILAGRQRMFD